MRDAEIGWLQSKSRVDNAFKVGEGESFSFLFVETAIIIEKISK